jgi:hypothetical protein
MEIVQDNDSNTASVCVCENLTLLKQAEKSSERAEMKFLLPFAQYTLCDHKSKEEVRELSRYNLNESIMD